MASTEVVELSGSDEDDFPEPARKPIGWNYQLGASKANKAKPRPNGTSAATPPPPAPASCSVKEIDDDLEIIEVNVQPKKKQKIMPSSSSRSEIRQQVRSSTQSTILSFFNNEKNAPDDTNRKGNRREKKETKSEQEEEEQEENDKSTASMEEFLRRWEEINIGKDDDKIRDKLWKHYHLAQTSYTHSKKFIQIIEGSTRKLTVDNIYVVIKDIVDCLKHYKDIPYREKGSGTESAGTSKEGTPVPNEAEDSKLNSRLRKVEKKMKEVANKIKVLEKAEVDLDDDDNSAYLVEDRLKCQFAKLHDYYCRIANCSTATGRPIERKFKYRGSRWMEINKRITTWVNKHKEFPDYVDILNLVKKVTKQSSLPLRPETVRVQAQEIFREVGKILKYRRESDDLYSIYSYMEEEEEEDPASRDQTLNQQLNENKKVATENLNKVFQEYVDKDCEHRKLADLATIKASETPEQQASPVKNPSRTVECQEEETSKTESESKIKEDFKGESSAATAELQVTVKSGSENCTENNRSVENGDNRSAENGDKEDTISDVDEDTSNYNDDTSSEDHETSDNEDDDDDDDTSTEDIEEHERQDTEEQNSCEGGKVEEELDDGDETDDDLKVVLASACVNEEEEEEDSEEDIPVMDAEELLELEGNDGENNSKNSVLCLDESSQEQDRSSKNSVLCLDDNSQENSMLCLNDDSQELNTTISTTLKSTDVLSTEEHNCTEILSSTTTTVAASPNASVNTSTTSTSIITSEPQRKRQLEESLLPCKKLCISDVELGV